MREAAIRWRRPAQAEVGRATAAVDLPASREGAMGRRLQCFPRSRVLSLLIGLLLLCLVHSEAQTVNGNARGVRDLVPIVLEMDWARGSPHYGPDFISLGTPCQRDGTSCECTMDFKVISSRENAKEFADYITSFDHGKVPVTYEVAYGQDGVVHGARLLSVGDWKREKFQTNDTLLGVKIKFSPDGPRKQSRNLSNPGDCFPAKIP
jgi:hypothetical protein